LPLLGHFIDLRRDPLGLMFRARRECGPIAALQIGPVRVYAVFHPDGVRRVLVDNAANYVKGPLYAKAAPMLGQGLLLSEGPLWRRQRRLAQPKFARARLAAFVPRLAAEAERIAARWQQSAAENAPIEVTADMLGLSLFAIGTLVFGDRVDHEAAPIARALPGVIRHVERTMSAIVPGLDRLPTPANRRFRADLATIDGTIARLIARGGSGDDLLSQLRGARDDETGEAMDDLQLRDEIKTLFLAGYDTTGHGMAWTWHLLSQNPDIQARLHAELDAVLAGRLPTADDLARLPYALQVLQESLRLYPPIWSIARASVAPDELCGMAIPAGAILTLNPYITHRDPDLWDRPERFDPDRFADGRERERPRFSYFPFGGGSRICIGQNFAVLEALTALAVLASRFAVTPAGTRTVAPLVSLSLRPRDGIHLRLRPR
jgi:cytochrome P450